MRQYHQHPKANVTQGRRIARQSHNRYCQSRHTYRKNKNLGEHNVARSEKMCQQTSVSRQQHLSTLTRRQHFCRGFADTSAQAWRGMEDRQHGRRASEGKWSNDAGGCPECKKMPTWVGQPTGSRRQTGPAQGPTKHMKTSSRPTTRSNERTYLVAHKHNTLLCTAQQVPNPRRVHLVRMARKLLPRVGRVVGARVGRGQGRCHAQGAAVRA